MIREITLVDAVKLWVANAKNLRWHGGDHWYPVEGDNVFFYKAGKYGVEVPDPEAKTEIWPVESRHGGLAYCHTSLGYPCLSQLQMIASEPRWTGRYRFTLPSRRKVTTTEPRILVKEDKFNYVVGDEDDFTLESHFSDGWTLAVPDGVEVVV